MHALTGRPSEKIFSGIEEKRAPPFSNFQRPNSGTGGIRMGNDRLDRPHLPLRISSSRALSFMLGVACGFMEVSQGFRPGADEVQHATRSLSLSRRLQLPSTWTEAPNHHRRRGGRSSIITFLNSRPSTSSPFTPFGSKCSSFLLSSHTIDDASCTSTSQLIQRRNGRRSKCSKPFRLIPRLDICCEIEIGSMARSSAIKSR